MSDRSPLQLSARGTVAANGTATLTYNGPGTNTRRELSTITVQCSTASPRPQCAVYRGSVAPHRQMALTRLGDADTFISDADVLESGEPLIIVWTGASPGATVWANLSCTDVTG